MAHIKKKNLKKKKKKQWEIPVPDQGDVQPASTPLMTLQRDGGRTCHLSLFSSGQWMGAVCV